MKHVILWLNNKWRCLLYTVTSVAHTLPFRPFHRSWWKRGDLFPHPSHEWESNPLPFRLLMRRMHWIRCASHYVDFFWVNLNSPDWNMHYREQQRCTFFSSLPFLSSFLVSSLTSVASGQERNTCLIILTMIAFRLWQSSPVTKDVWHPWFLSFLPSLPLPLCARVSTTPTAISEFNFSPSPFEVMIKELRRGKKRLTAQLEQHSATRSGKRRTHKNRTF